MPRIVDPLAVPVKGDQSTMAGVVAPTTPGNLGPMTPVPGPKERRAWENVSAALYPQTNPAETIAAGRAEVAQQMAQARAVREDGRAIRSHWNPLSSDKAPVQGEGGIDLDKPVLVEDEGKTSKEIGPDGNFGDYVDILRSEVEKSDTTTANMLNAGKNAAAALTEATEKDIVSYVQECFNLSYDRIGRRYDNWREADQAHDLYVPSYTVDAMQQSTKKGKRRKPRIIDVIRTPYSRAICDVRCTYNLAIFGGMPAFTIYPVRRTASKLAARIVQAELSQNMLRVGYERTLYQITLDQNRYGVSPTAVFYGRYGNQPINIDPWNYFPDPRVTMQTPQDADFIGVRSTASISALYRRGIYANLSRVEQNSTVTAWNANTPINDNARGTKPDPSHESTRTETAEAETKFGLGRTHVLNTLYAFISPKWFNIEAPFGLYRITVSDERTVIMFDRAPWPHKEFPIVSGASDWDAHKVFPSSAYDLGMPLQRFQDWLLRARVENTQNLIRGRMIADPTKVMVDDILNPNTARLIRALPGADLKGAVLPIDQADTTQNFWSEMENAGQLQQRLLAASDTAQGVQTDTQRSATEIARLTSLGQQRLGTQARMLSASQIRPMVLQMIQNLQYFGIHGGQVELPRELANTENGWYEWHQKEILGDFDYQLSDGTLPADPRQNTDNLMRALRIIGETNTAPDWKMARIFTELFVSMGFTDVEEWRNTPIEGKKQLGMQQAAAAANNPGVAAQLAQTAATISSDEDISRDLEKGNIVPLSQAMREVSDRMAQSPGPLRSEPTAVGA